MKLHSISICLFGLNSLVLNLEHSTKGEMQSHLCFMLFFLLASRSSLWKSWKERVIKRPATAHALRPDQMISDQFATKTKVSEIQDMLQELIGTAMFNKLENNAIKYISSTTVNQPLLSV